jgi:nitroreductase
MEMIEKKIDTRYPIHDLLRKRWSPRAFADREVEADKLSSMLEAARCAPSCFNEQPWVFIVGTRAKPEEHARLAGCLSEGNKVWATHAPVLMLSVAKLNFAHNDKPNRHALHDVGLAVENLIVQATSQGLYVHQMAGFDRDKARSDLGVPPDYEPVAMIAIGYLGDPDSLPEALAEREVAPRTRKPLEQFVFDGRWGKRSVLA